GRDGGHLVTKHIAHRLHFGHITYRRAGTVGVDVVDRGIDRRHCLLHAAQCTFAGRCDHVVAVRGGTVAGQFGDDGRATLAGMLQFFQYHHAATTGDDETVTVAVERA